jgi:hypothetical protein
MVMDITISIPTEMQEKLQRRAIENGQDVEAYVERLIEKALSGPPSIDELLAPVRKQFAESGMTEEELDALIEEAREEVWQEKQAQKLQ